MNLRKKWILVAALLASAVIVVPGDRVQSQNPAGPQIDVDLTNAHPTYANFSRVTGTPEEMILDFGLNPNPTGMPREPIVIDQRVVMSYYTAKRLLATLQISIERHEKMFGPVQIDVKKRMEENQQRTTQVAPNVNSPALVEN